MRERGKDFERERERGDNEYKTDSNEFIHPSLVEGSIFVSIGYKNNKDLVVGN